MGFNSGFKGLIRCVTRDVKVSEAKGFGDDIRGILTCICLRREVWERSAPHRSIVTSLHVYDVI